MVSNTSFLLSFASLANYKARVVNGEEIVTESDLCLITKDCLRDSVCQTRVMFLAERPFIVSEQMIVTVYKGDGKVIDMRDGQRVGKGEMVTLCFRDEGAVTHFADSEPVEVEYELAQETTVEETETQQVVTPVAAAPEVPGYVGVLSQAADYGVVGQVTPNFTSLKSVDQDFTVNPDYTVRIRARGGKWIDVKPGDNGLITIKKGTQSVYIFQSVRTVASR